MRIASNHIYIIYKYLDFSKLELRHVIYEKTI